MPLLCQGGVFCLFPCRVVFFSSVFPLNARAVQYFMVAAYRRARFLLARSVLVWLAVAGSKTHPGKLEEERCRGITCRERNGAEVQGVELGRAERDPRGGRGGRFLQCRTRSCPWNFTSWVSMCPSLSHHQLAALLAPGVPSPGPSAHVLRQLVKPCGPSSTRWHFMLHSFSF